MRRKQQLSGYLRSLSHLLWRSQIGTPTGVFSAVLHFESWIVFSDLYVCGPLDYSEPCGSALAG